MKKLLKESLKHWNVKLIRRKQKPGKVNIKYKIFQVESLSQLLFVLAIALVSMRKRKVKPAYDLGKGNRQINHS